MSVLIVRAVSAQERKIGTLVTAAAARLVTTGDARAPAAAPTSVAGHDPRPAAPTPVDDDGDAGGHDRCH